VSFGKATILEPVLMLVRFASDLWVQSSTCQGCQSNLTTDGSKASFDSQASTSYKASSSSQTVEVNYPSGANISGIVGFDKVSVG